MLDVVMAGRPATKPAPLFGQRLAAARKEKGLTQARLGELIGVSRELVDYYERRAPNPSLEFIQRAAEALGVEPGFFFEEGEPQRRKKPGPPSEFEQRLEQLRRLPRSQQELILRMLDAALGPQTEVRE
jgi:transcriptional regulator with XRE-family HTH domain